MLTPHTIATVTNPNLVYNTQDKVKRSHDHTIHALFSEDTALKHWFSRDDGVTWSSTTIESYGAGGNRQTAVDRDDNDNLYLIVGKSGTAAQQIITFRKGTVNKGVSPWTWSWGAETTISGAYISNASPDITVKDISGYVCIHVCWVCQAATSMALWIYSTNGGTSWSAITKIFPNNYKYFSNVSADALNNMFFFGSPSGGDVDYIKGRKVIYSAGSPPTWALDATTYNCSHVSNAGYTSVSRCLSNNKLVLLYPSAAVVSADIYFRKSTNVSNVSTWDTQVLIDTGVHYYSYGFLIYSDTRIVVYYQKTADFIIYSKESLDGGVTWGAAVIENNVGTQPCSLNLCVTPLTADKMDIIWRNNVTNPRTVYHAAIGDIIALDPITVQMI